MPVYLNYAPRLQDSTYSNVKEFLAQKVSPENQALSLKISGENLSDQDLQNLFEKIKNKKVESLDLSSSRMGDKEVSIVVNALKTHQTMRNLNLSHNNIGDKGALSLSQLMKSNPKLDIDLTHNRIGAAGGASFTEAAIATGKTKIDLTYNKLGDQGASAIGKALQRKSGAIREIFLKHNDISSKGDHALGETVPSHIKVYHKFKVTPFSEAHPFASLFLMILLPIPFIFMVPFMKSETDIEGCGLRQ